MRPCGEGLKIYLHRAPIDMRKGRNALAALAQEVIKVDPFIRSVVRCLSTSGGDRSEFHNASLLLRSATGGSTCPNLSNRANYSARTRPRTSGAL